MFKPALVVLVLLSTQGAFAARVDECLKPGAKLSTRLIGVVGDQKDARFDRAGSTDVLSTAKYEATVTTNTYEIFESTFCVAEKYTYQENVCQAVELGLALGRGNADFRALYDLNRSIINRAQLFANKILFNSADAGDVRLETAKRIVINLVSKAAITEIPTDWEDFSSHLNALASETKIEATTVDEILKVNEVANKKAFGFTPMANVKVTEQSGNVQFKSLFDLSKSEVARVKVLQSIFYSSEKILKGQVLNEATGLVRFLIEYASINGIPESWDQVTLMLKEAAAKKIITTEAARTMYRIDEEKNRLASGFQASAQKCDLVSKDAVVNVIDTRNEKSFLKEVSQNFVVNVANAPILPGESESFFVRYSGNLSTAAILVNSYYNSYTYSAKANEGTLTFEMTGTRQKVTPKNTLAGSLVNVAGIVDIMIQNKNYNPKIDGKIIVYATFFESRFLFDTELGTRVIEPKDGNLIKYLSQIKVQTPGRVIYAKIKIKYENSSVYNNQFSETIVVK